MCKFACETVHKQTAQFEFNSMLWSIRLIVTLHAHIQQNSLEKAWIFFSISNEFGHKQWNFRLIHISSDERNSRSFEQFTHFRNSIRIQIHNLVKRLLLLLKR